MSRKLIKKKVLKQVVNDQPVEFYAKDISEDERTKRAHPNLVGHRSYHSFVGGALSDHRGYLKIKEVQQKTRRGSLWRKVEIGI